MNPMRPGASLVLVGLMGAGKSAIGRRLAAQLGMAFVDSDQEVERAAGCSIAQLFEKHGEQSFREGERRVIRRLLQGGPIVLATGGGAYMDPTTRAAIREAGATTLWLRCDLETLVRRTAGKLHRPLLANGDPAEILAALMRERHPTYAESDVIVDCDNASPEITTRKVLTALDAHARDRRVTVALAGGRYEVVIGSGLLARAGSLLDPVLTRRAVAVVSDATVAALHLPALRRGLADGGFAVLAEIVLPAGEATKSLTQHAAVVSALLDAGVDRSTAVLALGGGVIGDLAGFAAASTLRGLPFVQIPTTLLAQVDSSVGGKTGVNTSHGKNLVGAFHQPVAVLADLAVLASLPARELRAGYAEILKAGLIGDPALFSWCEGEAAAMLAGDPERLGEAVARAVRFKAAVVADDEREVMPENGRALLNLGHTFAHAIEAALGYGAVLHGEAVAVGLGLACRLSARLGFCEPGLPERVEDHLRQVGLPARLDELPAPVAAADLLSRFSRDKKMRDGALHFVLLRGIGQAFTCRDVPASALRAILEESGATG